VLLGYARVSTPEQNADLQTDELTSAGCYEVFVDHASGVLDRRPELETVLERLRAGDTLVVWRLDRPVPDDLPLELGQRTKQVKRCAGGSVVTGEPLAAQPPAVTASAIQPPGWRGSRPGEPGLEGAEAPVEQDLSARGDQDSRPLDNLNDSHNGQRGVKGHAVRGWQPSAHRWQPTRFQGGDGAREPTGRGR